MLSQFSQQVGKLTLKDLFDVPKNLYPVGRLDYDSEGLLILTDDTSLNSILLNPMHRHEREYWAQEEGSIQKDALNQLENGVTINVNGKIYITSQCKAYILQEPLKIASRNPTIRFRKNIPESWIKRIVTEGKNRQVRKMTASVGHPTLRLIRYRIENITIEYLQPGEMKMLSQSELYNLLHIKKR